MKQTKNRNRLYSARLLHRIKLEVLVDRNSFLKIAKTLGPALPSPLLGRGRPVFGQGQNCCGACPFLAQSGQSGRAYQCPFFGDNAHTPLASMSAFDPKRTFSPRVYRATTPD